MKSLGLLLPKNSEENLEQSILCPRQFSRIRIDRSILMKTLFFFKIKYRQYVYVYTSCQKDSSISYFFNICIFIQPVIETQTSIKTCIQIL